ncbi:hypothetical protein E4U21_005418 [Claviceps maximensis]|nr:hypothetical protein E4U21_005418 [Claviceps maximensis]
MAQSRISTSWDASCFRISARHAQQERIVSGLINCGEARQPPVSLSCGAIARLSVDESRDLQTPPAK